VRQTSTTQQLRERALEKGKAQKDRGRIQPYRLDEKAEEKKGVKSE